MGILTQAQTPKYEFRGVWVSTVANIDWPSKTGLSTDELKTEIIRILDKQKTLHNNAIILQVRPASDAIYPSELEPWSRYLTGKQDVAPEGDFDPLKFWIDESHKRGMELHAWFNPYRIQQHINDTLSESHIINRHPDWGWIYGNKRYFEPGNPEVWRFIGLVVKDVVSRYDVDAIHFDDYFYPYKVNNQDFPDQVAFEKYGGKYYPDQIDDWRRHNVDTIIQVLNQTIKNTKPWVKFGISPFGVWRNRADDIRGSETEAGTTNYDKLYANIIKWQQLGWIDYTMPQLYWRDNHPQAGFTTLAYWWSDFNYGRAMYLGLAPYRIDKKSDYKQWRKAKYFYRQIEILRKINGIDGFGFFSSQHFFRKDFKKINKKMANSLNAKPAIVPPMPWIDNMAPEPPKNITIENNQLKWDAVATNNIFDETRFYVVYYYPEKQNKHIKSVDFLVEITGETQIKLPKIPNKGCYRISSLDRLNNESQLSDPFELNADN
jgi:uncharacterized lipoprotein YddW (UPF0748 family)